MPDPDPRDEWREQVRTRLAGVDADDMSEMVEELAQHLDDRYRELLDAGASEADARRAVLGELAAPHVLARAIGPVARPPAAPPPMSGRASGGRWWTGLGRDVRDGLRALRTSPGLALVAILTLAIGIGANAAIFSVVNAAMLRPLPFAEPERLVTFWGSAPAMGLPVVNYPDALFLYVRQRARTLGPMAAYSGIGVTLTGRGEAERLDGVAVTEDFFRALGRSPALGREFRADEHVAGRSPVVVLSDALWRRRFGASGDVLGRTITLDGRIATIVGVMPPGFDFPGRAELWLPLPLDAQSLNCWCYETVGRLAAGQTPESAARELALLNDDFWLERERKPRSDAAGEPKSVIIAQPLSRYLLGNVRMPLLVLSAAVAMVLLIACANIANLLLARATARAREIALRCCLGASPWLIVRQLLVESLLLAGAGALLGLGVAAAGGRLLGRFAAERLSHVNDVSLEPLVLLFTLGVTLATVVLFGVAPAVRGARLDLQEALKEGGRTTRTASSRRLSHAFVVAQLALSILLLIEAGLLMRSLGNLLSVDPGFRPENVLVGRVSLPPTDLPELERMEQSRLFFRQLVERVSALPDVRQVGLSSSAPFSDGDNQQIFTIKGREPAKDEPRLVASVRTATPGYFAAVGTRLLRGRVFEVADNENAPRVAIVDETLARRFWPDGNAVGQLVRLNDNEPWQTIVGVVAAVKHSGLADDPNRHVYVPHAQNPYGVQDLVVRTHQSPAAQTSAIRRQIQALDPSVPLYEVHTLEEAVARSTATERLMNVLLMAFAITALVLAAIGIYGVIALGVSQRVHEMAIRLAVGATPLAVVGLVMRQGLWLVATGIVIGLGAAAGLTRYIETLLFGVTPTDASVIATVTGILVFVALAACFIPARRATAVDPLEVLRA
jgi:putative ABC transport system permease protein